MPASNITAIPTILMMVKKVMPASVLDVGIGYGKYGCLIREWLSMEDYLKPKDQWAMRIDGVEVFPQYITPIHQHAYNNTMIGNAVAPGRQAQHRGRKFTPKGVMLRVGEIMNHKQGLWVST